MSSIAVIGDWQNAWVTAACLASFGHKITLVSRRPKLDLHEPGLDELLMRASSVGLFRRVHPEQWTDVNIVPEHEYAWVAFDTPVDDEGPNVAPVRLAAHWARLRSSKIILSSQVPLGFCSELEEKLRCPLAYVPENMRLGMGVETFCRPDRLIVGATDKSYAVEVASLLWRITAWRLFVDFATAEMIKHATNAFLATSISLVNELADISAPFGVNMELVAEALRADSRIGPKAYVRSGPGFAGGTLERDLKALQRLALPGAKTSIVDAVLDVNSRRSHPWAASCRCQTCWESRRD